MAASRLALLAAFAIAGCATTADLAPPVDAIVARLGQGTAAAPGDRLDLATLGRGRRIYLTTCTHCHAPESVSSVTPQEWPSVIDRMSERSGLDAEQRADVTAYVVAGSDAFGPGALATVPATGSIGTR